MSLTREHIEMDVQIRTAMNEITQAVAVALGRVQFMTHNQCGELKTAIERLVEERLLASANEKLGSTREQIIRTWMYAEKRIGKFVNLDETTIKSLLGVPYSKLKEEVQNILGRK